MVGRKEKGERIGVLLGPLLVAVESDSRYRFAYLLDVLVWGTKVKAVDVASIVSKHVIFILGLLKEIMSFQSAGRNLQNFTMIFDVSKSDYFLFKSYDKVTAGL